MSRFKIRSRRWRRTGSWCRSWCWSWSWSWSWTDVERRPRVTWCRRRHRKVCLIVVYIPAPLLVSQRRHRVTANRCGPICSFKTRRISVTYKINRIRLPGVAVISAHDSRSRYEGHLAITLAHVNRADHVRRRQVISCRSARSLLDQQILPGGNRARPARTQRCYRPTVAAAWTVLHRPSADINTCIPAIE